ncbi:Tat (twin-arginine translocation) pathway signal sequence [Micromonospora echinaurantiaca]|uniref:Tat (Twin-arginine translocation) pathway signal sequence n=2 Tax=Micromonospora echinaurantiaca TaxID=47857 RepID=A0A1C5I272_9ACTN|nr:Tat (twin-arginine translocation) pathway signal sequence [Micromonospora echinaurantiaca]
MTEDILRPSDARLTTTMTINRRTLLGRVAMVGAATATGALLAPGPARAASWKKRLTGADLDTYHRWRVAGTDLGIPYVLENGSIGYLFGDTFNTPWPEGPPLPNDWRSPVMLRSNIHPGVAGGVVFDSAARVAGNGRAPELMHNGHNGIGIDGLWEVTVIPNDGISFPETGRQLISYMSIENWASAGPAGPHWRSRYAGLAYSDNGNDFIRTPLKWWNNGTNTDPFQMWTMQRDGDWVYVFSVRSGRQDGPMMLRRVRWDRLFYPESYEGWGWNGSNWGWGRPCTPILTGRFGEPSVRRLADGSWVMSYLNCATGCIVTRTAGGPDQVWTAEKVQVTPWQEPGLYGGFIHPWSSRRANDLHLMVSKWTRTPDGRSTAYHVSQFVGTA